MSQAGIFLFEAKANSKSVCTKKTPGELWDWKVKHFHVTYVTDSSCLCLYIKLYCLRIQEETFYLYFLDLYMTKYLTGKTEPIHKIFWTAVNKFRK